MPIDRLIRAVLFSLLASGVAHAAGVDDIATLEKAGRHREALARAVAAIEAEAPGSAREGELFAKAIGLAQRLKPAPKAPEAAERHLARARAAVRSAAGDADLRSAAEEFRAAARAAPWLAEAHFNLGLVLAKLGRHDEAIASLKRYLDAAPQANDRREVQNRIYEIEFERDKAGKAAAAKAQEAGRIAGLAGAWRGSFWNPNQWSEKPTFAGTGWTDYARLRSAQVQISGDEFDIRTVTDISGFSSRFRGRLDGTQLKGNVVVTAPPSDDTCPNWSYSFPFEGTLDLAGNRILLLVRGFVSGTQHGCAPGFDAYALSVRLLR